MIFDCKSIERLSIMGINADEYAKQLAERFGRQGSLFQELIEAFWDKPLDKLDSTPFNEFYASSELLTEGEIYNEAYEFFNCLRVFKNHGKLALYKHRQAEWKGPIIVLKESDVPDKNLHLLTDKIKIYRGMSIEEFDSKNLGQSWTTDMTVAMRFAKATYEDQLDGIVVMANLNLSNIIYVFPNDHESEVVVAKGSISAVSRISA